MLSLLVLMWIFIARAGMFVVAFASSICPVSLIKNNSGLATNILDVVLCWSMTGKIYKSTQYLIHKSF